MSPSAKRTRARSSCTTKTTAPGSRLPGLINDLQSVVIDGGPHAIPWTHVGQVNAALLSFIGAHADAAAR
jgi:hypothetical protein